LSLVSLKVLLLREFLFCKEVYGKQAQSEHHERQRPEPQRHGEDEPQRAEQGNEQYRNVQKDPASGCNGGNEETHAYDPEKQRPQPAHLRPRGEIQVVKKETQGNEKGTDPDKGRITTFALKVQKHETGSRQQDEQGPVRADSPYDIKILKSEYRTRDDENYRDACE
jgi:hypothetical protein